MSGPVCIFVYNRRERDIPHPIVTRLHCISRFAYGRFEFEIIIIFVPDKNKPTSRILMHHPYIAAVVVYRMVITSKRLDIGLSAINRHDNNISVEVF